MFCESWLEFVNRPKFAIYAKSGKAFDLAFWYKAAFFNQRCWSQSSTIPDHFMWNKWMGLVWFMAFFDCFWAFSPERVINVDKIFCNEGDGPGPKNNNFHFVKIKPKYRFPSEKPFKKLVKWLHFNLFILFEVSFLPFHVENFEEKVVL